MNLKKKKQEGIYGMVWRDVKKGKNVIIVL